MVFDAFISWRQVSQEFAYFSSAYSETSSGYKNGHAFEAWPFLILFPQVLVAIF
jgi:hypothetical protein